jgi:hypothetical protein
MLAEDPRSAVTTRSRILVELAVMLDLEPHVVKSAVTVPRSWSS